MDRRTDDAPLFGESLDLVDQGYSSNMKMMAIAAAFLIVAIGVLLIQPNPLSQDMAVAEPVEPTPVEIVTRSQTSLLAVEVEGSDQIESRPQNVSDLMRAHASLANSQRTIDDLSWDALFKFGHAAPLGDPLHKLLAQALMQGQSDAYIDALLNISVERGDVRAPIALQTTTGRLNTQALLQELVTGLNP